MPPADLTPDSQRARGGGSGVAAVGARPEENGTKREAKTAMGVVGSPGRGRRVLRAINLSWRDSPLRSFALPASGTPFHADARAYAPVLSWRRRLHERGAG